MSTTVLPLVIDALVALTRAELGEVAVSDGYPITDSSQPDLLMVGIEDATIDDAANSAESQQTPATMSSNRSRDETGTVTCLAESVNGDADQKAARDSAFATVSAVEELCRTTPNLEIASVSLLVAGVASIQLFQNQTEKQGAVAQVVFKVGFRARL